jgi:hypothetical protein
MFNRRIGGNGTVGLWHEMYTVAPGQYQSFYNNMPRFGLAGAMPHMPITGRTDSARLRMGKTKAPAPDQN